MARFVSKFDWFTEPSAWRVWNLVGRKICLMLSNSKKLRINQIGLYGAFYLEKSAQSRRSNYFDIVI